MDLFYVELNTLQHVVNHHYFLHQQFTLQLDQPLKKQGKCLEMAAQILNSNWKFQLLCLLLRCTVDWIMLRSIWKICSESEAKIYFYNMPPYYSLIYVLLDVVWLCFFFG